MKKIKVIQFITLIKNAQEQVFGAVKKLVFMESVYFTDQAFDAISFISPFKFLFRNRNKHLWPGRRLAGVFTIKKGKWVLADGFPLRKQKIDLSFATKPFGF